MLAKKSHTSPSNRFVWLSLVPGVIGHHLSSRAREQKGQTRDSDGWTDLREPLQRHSSTLFKLNKGYIVIGEKVWGWGVPQDRST